MGMSFFSIDEVKEAMKVAIDFYNNERPHMSLEASAYESRLEDTCTSSTLYRRIEEKMEES